MSNSNWHRRDFLKATAAGAGLLALELDALVEERARVQEAVRSRRHGPL